MPPPVASGDAALPGFRADAWFLPDDDLLGFVEIPAGPFLMGSDSKLDPRAFENERWSTSSDQGTVELLGLLHRSLRGHGRAVPRFRRGDGIPRRRTRRSPEVCDRPVSFVVVARRARLRPVARNDAAGFVPSSAAAATPARRRVARDAADGSAVGEGGAGNRRPDLPWGNEPRHDRANFGGAGVSRVGSFPCPECPFNLSDMSGNVWELTRSPYRPYPYDSRDDNIDLDADALWVMRGGSYGDTEQNVRAAVRGGVDPGARRPFIGFRVVLSRIGPLTLGRGAFAARPSPLNVTD